MKSEQLITLIIRLMIVYLSLTVLFQSLLMALSFVYGYQDKSFTFALVYGGIFLVISCLFILAWKKSTLLARKIMPDIKESPIGSAGLSLEQIQVLLFAILGAWVALDSFSTVARGLLVFSFSSLKGYVIQADFYAHVIRLLIGVWLLLSAKGFANIVNKLRS